MSMLNTMPFLNADDHILHQDRLALDGTAYWPDMENDTNNEPHPLLDPYIDPETVMNASEALMRMSEQEFSIEPSLRSLNVNDPNTLSASTPFHASGTSNNNPSHHTGFGYGYGSNPFLEGASYSRDSNTSSNSQQRHLPAREPFDGKRIRQWTEQFERANTSARRWFDTAKTSSGPHLSGSYQHAIPETSSQARAPDARLSATLSKAGPSGRTPAQAFSSVNAATTALMS